MTKFQEHIVATFPELMLKIDYPLAPLSYFKVGGPAEAYLATNNKEICQKVYSFCLENNYRFTMLGGGSNVIVSDEGVKGLVMQYTNENIEHLGIVSDNNFHLVQTSAGIKMAIMVAKTVNMGLTGLEYFLGVPGTLGGAVYNNSHYLSELIGEHILRVEIIDQTGSLKWLTNQECEFGYDSSRFHRTREIILTVEFRLAEGNQLESTKLIREATEYRALTQPLGPPSSGCVFQNVPNDDRLRKLFPEFSGKSHVPGGFIIDQAGLKGTRVGGVHVSEKHAAWFINDGTATAKDVQLLAQNIKESVKEKFGIAMKEEIFYLK